jgi:hypothetical protein
MTELPQACPARVFIHPLSVIVHLILRLTHFLIILHSSANLRHIICPIQQCEPFDWILTAAEGSAIPVLPLYNRLHQSIVRITRFRLTREPGLPSLVLSSFIIHFLALSDRQ